MELSSMLVSRDYQEISVLECILGGLHISVDVEPQPERARAKLSKSKVDALIVDSDLAGTGSLLRDLRHDAWQNLVPLVIMGTANPQERRSLDRSGSVFRFDKPISVDQAVRVLSSARNQILDGRLRYHRHAIDAQVLVIAQKTQVRANISNLSQGGIGIHGNLPHDLAGRVVVKFVLPRKSGSLRIPGEIVWTKPEGRAGIRFVEMSPDTHRDLQLWLEQQCLVG
jgi:hypothetical protein